MTVAVQEWKAKFGDDKMFNAYDLDGDGVISPDEWMLGEVTQPLPADAPASSLDCGSGRSESVC